MTIAILLWQVLIFLTIYFSNKRGLVSVFWIIWTIVQVAALPLSILQFITVYIGYQLSTGKNNEKKQQIYSTYEFPPYIPEATNNTNEKQQKDDVRSIIYKYLKRSTKANEVTISIDIASLAIVEDFWASKTYKQIVNVSEPKPLSECTAAAALANSLSKYASDGGEKRAIRNALNSLLAYISILHLSEIDKKLFDYANYKIHEH